MKRIDSLFSAKFIRILLINALILLTKTVNGGNRVKVTIHARVVVTDD